MIRIGIGAVTVLVLALAAVTGPDLASMANSVQVSGIAPRADRTTAVSAPVAWVVNQSVSTGSVTPIDTATNKVIKKIPVSQTAIDVAITPGGKIAYVALDAPCPGCRGSVIPVSTSTYQVGKPVKVGILPATMAMTPNGKTLYVGDWDSGTVTPIRTATNTAGKPINTSAVVPSVVSMAVTPNGKTVYVVNEDPPTFTPAGGGISRVAPWGRWAAVGRSLRAINTATSATGTVTPINTATNTAGKPITVGVTPGAIVITPDGKTAYVLNLADGAPGKGSVTPINIATKTAGKPIPIKGASFPDTLSLLAISPNGKTIYAVGNSTMTPIDTATNTAGPTIRVAPSGGGDYSAAITPDGKTLYIDGITGSGTKGFIVPVNTATGAVGKAIIVSGYPYPMGITPNGKTLYVLCAGGPGPQDVIPVNTATNTAGPAIQTGQSPMAIAITTGH
jgi:DNA-binding beta-propeller fold protein YncE